MKPRSIEWLVDVVTDKVTVLGEIGAFLFSEKRTDLMNQARALRGDHFTADHDEFFFFAQTHQGPMPFPLTTVEPVVTQYTCKYEHIHSVFEDDQGRPVVVLKDASLGN